MLRTMRRSKMRYILPGLSAVGFVMLIAKLSVLNYYYRTGANKSPNMADVAIKKDIAILNIIRSGSEKAKYKTAMDSMECYAIRNNYPYLELHGEDFKALCGQDDIHIHFQRHCIVAHILETYNFTWVFLTEGDIGVVNEKKMLEEYVKEHADIVFYDRFFSFEVTAGSYFARKSNFSLAFLRGWADYSFRLPKTFGVLDNEAIHMWLVEMLAPNAPLAPVCWLLWRTARNFETLSYFTVCCREAVKNVTLSQIYIYKRGEAWVRDGWLTNSHWNPQRDFMFHGLKEKDKKRFVATQKNVVDGPWFYPWFDTLRAPLNLNKCKGGEQTWNHEAALITSKQAIDSHLEQWRRRVELEYHKKLLSVQRMANRLYTAYYRL
ncbi:unnamed protein product [Cylicocyclus nassatus]|uniref:Uncharacterized protein n=1 Tax=Cylicocyclus nassatus TaxID=53992 RepID=A0AA36H8X2_CYLNA|nr:unnamed protein product [Cylicocyclus nassatus]